MDPYDIANRVHRVPKPIDNELVCTLRVFAVDNPDCDLIRVGPNADGGYIVYKFASPQYDGCLSGGVGEDVSFEIDFLSKHETMECDIYDHTVHGLPENHPRLHWIAQPMSSCVLRDFLQTRQNVFFKCDIEGGEWETLHGALDMRERLQQVVVEIHGLGDAAWPWGAHAMVEQQRDVLQAMATTHYLVHVRGNTCSPLVPMGNVYVPEVIELTYVRKNVFFEPLSRNSQSFPRMQDIANVTSHSLVGEPWQCCKNVVAAQCLNGLANRIKTIVSCLHTHENDPFRVNIEAWPLNERDDAPFARVFDDSHFIAKEESNAKGFGWRLFLTDEDRRHLPQDFARGYWMRESDPLVPCIDFEYWRIPEVVRKSFVESFSVLKPSGHIDVKVSEFFEERPEFLNATGVQLRFWVDDASRSDSLFLQQIEEALRLVLVRNPKARFVMTSDDTNRCQPLMGTFGEDRFIIPKAVFETKMELAMFELLVLSKLPELIVTHCSTFGEVAWWLGGAEATIVGVVGRTDKKNSALLATDGNTGNDYVVSRPPSKIHIICQPYSDPHPERAAELAEVLQRNLDHPGVEAVHVIIEKNEAIEDSLPINHPKLVLVRDQPRLTFEHAFAYANATLHGAVDVACVLNADVYLDSEMVPDRAAWTELCRDGRPRMLSRWEMHPNGTVSMNAECTIVEGTSFDAWICPVPIPEMDGLNFRVGNQLGCDEHMVVKFIDAGLIPINDAVRFPIIHLDKCAHRNRQKCTVYNGGNSSTSKEAETHSDNFAVRGKLRLRCDTHEERARLRACDFWRNDLTHELENLLRRQRVIFGDGVNEIINGQRRCLEKEHTPSLESRFHEVFSNRLWGDEETVSGPGSCRNSQPVLDSLTALKVIVCEHNIKSMVDIPCGDFNWMHLFLKELPELLYTGIDIVPEIIQQNQAKFPDVSFLAQDITKTVPVCSDLLFSKDMLNHLCFEDVRRALRNMHASGSRLLLLTNNFGHANLELDYDVTGWAGASRHLDITLSPFNFPEPLWRTDYFGLWDLNDCSLDNF